MYQKYASNIAILCGVYYWLSFSINFWILKQESDWEKDELLLLELLLILCFTFISVIDLRLCANAYGEVTDDETSSEEVTELS